MSNTPHLYSPYDGPMWESIQQEQMKLQRCTENGLFRFPPGPACPETLSMEYEWAPISGRGKILAWTVFHRTYLKEYPAPHLVVAIELEEGPTMISYMDHEDLPRVGLDVPVKLTYVDHPKGYKIPKAIFDQ